MSHLLSGAYGPCSCSPRTALERILLQEYISKAAPGSCILITVRQTSWHCHLVNIKFFNSVTLPSVTFILTEKGCLKYHIGMCATFLHIPMCLHFFSCIWLQFGCLWDWPTDLDILIQRMCFKDSFW